MTVIIIVTSGGIGFALGCVVGYCVGRKVARKAGK